MSFPKLVTVSSKLWQENKRRRTSFSTSVGVPVEVFFKGASYKKVCRFSNQLYRSQESERENESWY